MSPSSLSSKTQTHTARMTITITPLSSQPKKVTTCFVLDDCSGDSETLASEAGQNVPLPTESTNWTDVSDTDSIFDVHAVDNDDEPWLTETEYNSGWNTRFKSGMSRGMLCGVVSRNYPKQVVSLIKAENVPANMHKFPPWTQKHNRIDATTSNLQRKTGEPTFVVPCPSGCKEFTHKGSKEHFVRSVCKIRGTVRKDRRTPRLDSTPCSQRQGEEPTLEKIHRVDPGTCIDSALREIYDAYKAACSVSIIKP